MLNNIQNSIKAILYERVSSPFFGAFIVSWIIWNWKILYLTLFVSEGKISGNKIDYIILHYTDTWNLIIYPIISTILLITVIPFITNAAYYLNLKFINWRREIKDKLEKNHLLTLEKSIALREEIKNMQESFNSLLDDKNEEISLLESKVEELMKNEDEQPIAHTSNSSSEYSRLISTGIAREIIEKYKQLLDGEHFSKSDFKNIKEILLYDLMKTDRRSNLVYLSEKGRDFIKWYLLNFN